MKQLEEPSPCLKYIDDTFISDQIPRLFRSFRKGTHGFSEEIKAAGLSSDVYDLSIYKNKPDTSIGPRMRFRSQMSHQCAMSSQYVTDSIS